MDRVGREDLATKMVEKTDAQLLDMFAEPSEWTQEALDAARAELRQRAVPLPPEPAQPVPSQQEQAKLAKALRIIPGQEKNHLGYLSYDLLRAHQVERLVHPNHRSCTGFCGLLPPSLGTGQWTLETGP